MDATSTSTNSYLDAGCATGEYVQKLRCSGYQAWGVDVLPYAQWSSPWFVRADGGQLPLRDGAVSVAFAFEVMEHLVGPEAFLTELRRVSTQRVVLSVPNCEVPAALSAAGLTFHHWVDPTHVNFFTADSLAALIESSGLQLEYLTTFNPIRPEMLALQGLGLSERASSRIGRIFERLPRRATYDMSLIACARV